MRDRQKESAREKLRSELKSDDTEGNSLEFTKAEIDLTDDLTDDLTIEEIDLTDSQYSQLYKKMKWEYSGYILRVIILITVISLALLIGYMINTIVFRLMLFTTVVLIIAFTSSKDMLDYLVQKVDKNNLNFIKDKENVRTFIGISTRQSNLKNGITAVYFGNKYLLLRDQYSLWSYEKNDVILIIYNKILDDIKIRDIENTFKIKLKDKEF